MANDRNPMNLEDLPGYLKSQRESEESGNSPIIQTGQIIAEPEVTYKWRNLLGFAALLLGLTMVWGVMQYNKDTENITFMVENQSPETITKILSETNSKLISMEQKSDKVYEVKLTAPKSKRPLLDILLNNKKPESK